MKAIDRDCKNCVKKNTIYCPNSKICYDNLSLPYFQDRIMLLKENEVLKKQLENISEELELVMCDLHNRTSERDSYERKLNESLSQQKEFINYLEDEINNIKKQIKNYDIWQGVDYNFLITKRQFNIKILKKYKEIIGVSNEKEN